MAQEYEAVGSGPQPTEGQAKEQAPEEAEGQPVEDSGQTEGQADAGTPQTVDNDPEKLLASYNELRKEFDSRNVSSKELKSKYDELDTAIKNYGGIDGVNKWANWINQNQEALGDMIRNQQTSGATGINLADADDETRKAVGMVNNMIESALNRRDQQLIDNNIKPVADSLKEKLLEENMDTLSNRYPDNFDEMRDKMAELSDNLPAEMRDNPSLEQLDDLYWKAIREAGKMEEVAAKMHQKKLETMKGKSQEKPGSPAGKGAVKQANTMQEAAQMAKEQTGLSF